MGSGQLTYHLKGLLEVGFLISEVGRLSSGPGHLKFWERVARRFGVGPSQVWSSPALPLKYAYHVLGVGRGYY